jgi:DNA recombination-dependent growth factor C
MWFRNLQIFRLTSDWAYGAEALSAALHKGLFHGCGATDRSRARLGASARRT